MGTERAAPFDPETIKAACRRVLWDITPYESGEAESLVEALEGFVRQLSPEVAALTPTLEDEMQGAAMHTLRYADDVLDPAAPRADRPARLHDLGVIARSLLTVVEMTAEYEARRGLDGAAAGHR
ncbi:DUF6415 family natural product biosynthesis protein [Streptomyces sp. NPDC002076]